MAGIVETEFPLPFAVYSESEYGIDEWGPAPKTLAELRMYALSWAIRAKPGWRHKMENVEILEKWRKEALEQQEPLPLEKKMTSNMVNYVLTELKGYSALCDEEQGFEDSKGWLFFDSIWYLDGAISEELLQRLKTSARKFEDVPDDQKDWHPGSSQQVLDLVHPSMYCVRYGRTQAFIPGAPRTASNLLLVHPPDLETPEEQPWLLSTEFSWLPSDYKVAEDGSVHLLSPYINNVHPEHHQPLYRVIEDVITVLVPVFERVLGEIVDRPTVPGSGAGRIQVKELDDCIGVQCIWAATGWQPKELPDSHETYTGALEALILPLSLRGRTIQCIIKLANIHLTPEQPEYLGGSWHVEGMLNEFIVASGIYYYDEENITESELAFRVAYDTMCMQILYNITTDEPCVQDIGAMNTKSGRVLVWPNIYQHRVSPFRLVDPAKPGHRKILAIFLAEWAAEALNAARNDPASLVSRLPQELCDLVAAHFPDSLMTTSGAKSYCAELMTERTAFVQDQNEEVFGSTFNMCEH
ncbi:hypothetical protein B0H11DRAFT_2173252 [Mycena galericulata]|nr:hypothetical protein B0H11DRAFT_2173252 [Mycena galericulata]